MNSELPIQVDGEPWIQSAGEIVVLKSALKVSSPLFIDFVLIVIVMVFVAQTSFSAADYDFCPIC